MDVLKTSRLTGWKERAVNRIFAVKVAKLMQALLFIDTSSLMFHRRRSLMQRFNFFAYRAAVVTFQVLWCVRFLVMDIIALDDPKKLDWWGDFNR